MAPVALGVEISEIELVLQPLSDRGRGACDLAGHERLAADRRFMVEQDAVRGMHAIGFAIVDDDPVGIEFRRGIGRARVERRSEEHTSELQSLMRISYAVFCLK